MEYRKPKTIYHIQDALKLFKDVGRVLYNLPRTKHAPDTKYLQITILQLLATSIIQLRITDEHPTSVISLSIESSDSSPNYLLDCYWVGIPLVETADYL